LFFYVLIQSKKPPFRAKSFNFKSLRYVNCHNFRSRFIILDTSGSNPSPYTAYDESRLTLFSSASQGNTGLKLKFDQDRSTSTDLPILT